MDPETSDQDADTAAREEGQVRLFEHVRAGLYIGEIGGPTTAANPHLKTIFGFPLDTPNRDVRPFDVDRFTDPREHTAFLAQLSRDGHVDDYALRLRRDDGAQIWIEVSASIHAHPAHLPHLPHPAHPTHPAHTAHPAHLTHPAHPAHLTHPAHPAHLVYAIVRDVTNRKRDDDHTRDLHHQLEQAEKMAALGQTISGVAHELNNPLATILSWAERLAAGPADEKTRRGLDVIRGESERAARIVRNLLTFARKRQTTRMMVDVNELIRETLALRAYEQRVSNVRITQSLASGIPRVFADGYQIKQVFLNLVINAEQAMQSAKGGSITIRTWQDDGVVIEVKDEGPGITEERQARIFDPFYTTKEVGKGTGLGLSVAYGIVHEHGGRIWVMSRPGEGAAFYVQLPIAPADPRTAPAAPSALEHRTAPPAPSAPAAPTAPEFSGKRVLVVEDEAALASAVADALGDAGFVVDRAADGEEALTSVALKTYDLIVCDLKMPKLDGMQFYRAMAAAAPPLARRVIFVTGAVTGTDAERFLEETACRWLPKPFRLADLLRAARDTLS